MLMQFYLISLLCFLRSALSQIPNAIQNNVVDDFSYAGYKSALSYPNYLNSDWKLINVQNFGAVPNDGIDDTAAIQAAINSAPSDAIIMIPAGNYTITTQLLVENKQNFSIVGDSSGKTIFYSSFNGEDAKDPRFDNYQYGLAGHLLYFRSDNWLDDSATLTVQAKKGDFVLTVNNVSKFQPGQAISIRISDLNQNVSPSIWAYFHNVTQNIWMGQTQKLMNENMYYRIKSVNATKKQITLYEPLRTNLYLSWQPVITRVMYYCQNVGVSFLTFQFSNLTRPGHIFYKGYNGLGYRGCQDFWGKSLTFNNTDHGIMLYTSYGGLFKDINFIGRGGHHGIDVNFCSSVVFHGLYFNTVLQHIHDATVSDLTNYAIISNGRSNFPFGIDGHRKIPYQNLYTDFTSITWDASSGNWEDGPHFARDNVFWGLGDSQVIVPSSLWPENPDIESFYCYQNKFITKQFTQEYKTLAAKCKNVYNEEVPNLSIPNLYLYQLQQRCFPCFRQLSLW
ncbi:hypothetical protein ABPG72_017468 [Tetrahymena utriculariae]